SSTSSLPDRSRSARRSPSRPPLRGATARDATFRSCLQSLPEAPNQRDFVEAAGAMDLGAERVIGLSIGGKLRAPLRSPPVFRGTKQRAPDALAACLLRHKPAFEIRDRAGLAAFRIRTQRQFDESDERTMSFADQPRLTCG